MDRDPIKTAVRSLRKSEQSDRRICTLCGCIRRVEFHHVSCRKHDPVLTIAICRSCHEMLTEGQLREGVSMRFEPNPIVRAVRILESWAAFFEQFAQAIRRLADQLRDAIKT